jgi:hypothetical protein
VISLLFFVLIGLGLLASLYFFARSRGTRVEGSAETFIEARQALQSLQMGLLPPEFVGRIFAKDDRDYVAASAPVEIQKLFLQERKRIALMWVSKVRTHILDLRRFHLGRSRFHARLDLASEIGLAMDFAALLAACRMLQVALYFRGPYAAPGIVGTTATVATRLCEISEKSLTFLKPSTQSAVASDSAPIDGAA